MNISIRLLSATIVCAATSFASMAHAKPMTQEQARVIIAPLYQNFSVPQGNVTENVTKGTTADWQSCVNDVGCRNQEASIKSFTGLATMIPDLKLTVKQIVTQGNTIVVRSQLDGTPAGEFFGVPHTGKSFSIMTIDMHTVKNGKISHTNHLEDWAGALRQLRGN